MELQLLSDFLINGGIKLKGVTKEATAAAGAAKQRRMERKKLKLKAADHQNGSKQQVNLNDNHVPEAPAMIDKKPQGWANTDNIYASPESSIENPGIIAFVYFVRPYIATKALHFHELLKSRSVEIRK